MKSNYFQAFGLLLIAASLTACGRTYDCANPEVTAGLVEQVANHAKKTEWAEAIRDNTQVDGVMTQDADEKLGHFVCSTKLTYTDEDRKLESLDINYEVKRMEGGDSPFELSWETIPTLLGDADPIANLAGRITYPWIQKEKEEQGRIWTMKQKEVEVLAKNEVIAYAKANPPIPRTREELLQEASTAELESGSMSNPALIEAVLTETSFGDLNGDGHDDLAAIQAYKERDLQRGESGTVTTYTLWVFEQYPVKYGERFLVRPVSLGTIGMSSNDQAPPYSHLKIADGKVSVGTPDGEEHKVGINKLEPFPAFDNEQYNAMVSDRLNKLRAELNQGDTQ